MRDVQRLPRFFPLRPGRVPEGLAIRSHERECWGQGGTGQSLIFSGTGPLGTLVVALSGGYRARSGRRGQAGADGYEPAHRRTRTSGGRGVPPGRCSNLAAGAGWNSGSAAGSRATSAALHGSRPRVGVLRGGAVAMPMWRRTSGMVDGSVMMTMIRIFAPQSGHAGVEWGSCISHDSRSFPRSRPQRSIHRGSMRCHQFRFRTPTTERFASAWTWKAAGRSPYSRISYRPVVPQHDPHSCPPAQQTERAATTAV